MSSRFGPETGPLQRPTVERCGRGGHGRSPRVPQGGGLGRHPLARADFATAVKAGDPTVVGPRPLVRALPTWFIRSLFAPVPFPG